MVLKQEVLSNLTRQPKLASRVLHGRGKSFTGLEALNIEWYPPYLFVQNFSDTVSENQKNQLLEVFEACSAIKAILVQSREWPDFKTEVLVAREVGDAAPELPLETWVNIADDISIEVKLGKNRNTGVFLDMRAGWHWIKEHAEGKRVLNLFSYTSVFSLFALRGGAQKVDNVDMAANVLKIAQRNHQKNQIHDGKAAFYKRNILKSDRWMESRGGYDLIIIDPPPYQKKGFHGWKDYEKLLKQCRIALNKDGQMFACLNNPQASIEDFENSLHAAFPEAKSFERIDTADEIKELDPRKGLKTIVVQF